MTEAFDGENPSPEPLTERDYREAHALKVKDSLQNNEIRNPHEEYVGVCGYRPGKENLKSRVGMDEVTVPIWELGYENFEKLMGPVVAAPPVYDIAGKGNGYSTNIETDDYDAAKVLSVVKTFQASTSLERRSIFTLVRRIQINRCKELAQAITQDIETNNRWAIAAHVDALKVETHPYDI